MSQGRVQRLARFVLALLLPVSFITGYLARGGSSSVEPVIPSTGTANPENGSAEVGFARDMTVHHAQAVDMAERIRARTSDSALRLLATDIVLTQQNQIGRFQGWLEQWNLPPSSTKAPMAWMTGTNASAATPGSEPTATTIDSMAGMETMELSTGAAEPMAMPGMAARGEVSALSALPVAEAERSFLELMIRHHEGGLSMANAVLTRTDRPEVTRIAKSIVASQTGEIQAMRQLLANRTTGKS